MMTGLVYTQELGRLKQAMFLGLARQSLPVPEAIQTLLATTSQQEPVLAVLALAAQRQRFDRPTMERTADGDPEAARRLHADQRPIIPEPARRLLLRLANGVEKGLADAVVSTAVHRIMRAGFRLHPFDLPRLIGYIKGDARCLGLAERAYLLLSDTSTESDAPSLLHAEIAAENWTKFPKGHRVAFLREERRKDPAGARALIESAFKSEPAAVRADLLAALEIGLSANDLPLLEGMTVDRAESVRNVASRLTASIPGTPAYASRLAEAARCFARTASTVSGILKRVGLASSADVTFAPPKRSNVTEQRGALAHLFEGYSMTEIAATAAITIDELVSALPVDDDTVLTALCNRAQRDRDEEAMLRLATHRITNLDAKRFSLAALLAWLAENLAGPVPAEFGKNLLPSAAWQATIAQRKEAVTPGAMKDDGTLIWTAAILPTGLLPSFQEAMTALQPATTRSARDFTDLVLALDTLQPRER
jgi:hypothetical protein